MTTLLFVRCIRPLSSVVKKKVSPLARFHKVNFFIGSSKNKNNKQQKKRKKEHAPKETADKIFYISEREREREREDEDEEEEDKR